MMEERKGLPEERKLVILRKELDKLVLLAEQAIDKDDEYVGYCIYEREVCADIIGGVLKVGQRRYDFQSQGDGLELQSILEKGFFAIAFHTIRKSRLEEWAVGMDGVIGADIELMKRNTEQNEDIRYILASPKIEPASPEGIKVFCYPPKQNSFPCYRHLTKPEIYEGESDLNERIKRAGIQAL